MILFLILSCSTFYSYGFVTYSGVSVTNPQSTSGQTTSWSCCEFCLHSGTHNWTTGCKTKKGCIKPDLYSLYWEGNFQPGNLLNWQWLPHWVKWYTQASVPGEQFSPQQGRSTEMSHKLTERKKAKQHTRSSTIRICPPQIKRSSSFMLNIFS